ncbi:hypothetical protein CIL05_13430 [Virgibacillus profundi]|uniref:non-specific serine/threonine protein kinase n=1 Tax=Virgibacillus profundi TaxID=2024555 RepID=A0A2A2IBI7_9BACI|nr:serine/threonine-protein kinase [Virgibacillus profundi]PAV28977.1 hypothetical protein CIL05_13430 [Virgibacillus profundi]PXY53145.1 serine/threonine protein kinase [Virgibacillus profundi]
MFNKQEVINNKYKIIDYLTEGGTSLLYDVEVSSGKHAILKVAKNTSTLFNNQIDNEAKILAAVNHDRLPKLFDKLTVNRHYKAIVIEKIEAVSLSDLIENGNKVFSWQEILDIAKQIMNIIDVFHKNNPSIVIRDIKPSNILISNNNHAYLIDFGVSASIKEKEKISALGTIGYAAPEQFENGKVDLRSDFFSLGAVLFYMASNGENIYTSNQAAVLKEQTPKAFAEIIIKLSQTDPDKRYDNSDEIVHAFSKVKPNFKERFKELIYSND